MSDVLDVLVRARELIADPARWTQGAFARNKDGQSCAVTSGVQFCAYGARTKAFIEFGTDLDTQDQVGAFMRVAAKRIMEEHGKAPWNCIVIVNDRLGHEAALRMFDLAINAAKEEERNERPTAA